MEGSVVNLETGRHFWYFVSRGFVYAIFAIPVEGELFLKVQNGTYLIPVRGAHLFLFSDTERALKVPWMQTMSILIFLRSI